MKKHLKFSLLFAFIFLFNGLAQEQPVRIFAQARNVYVNEKSEIHRAYQVFFGIKGLDFTEALAGWTADFKCGLKIAKNGRIVFNSNWADSEKYFSWPAIVYRAVEINRAFPPGEYTLFLTVAQNGRNYEIHTPIKIREKFLFSDPIITDGKNRLLDLGQASFSSQPIVFLVTMEIYRKKTDKTDIRYEVSNGKENEARRIAIPDQKLFPNKSLMRICQFGSTNKAWRRGSYKISITASREGKTEKFEIAVASLKK